MNAVRRALRKHLSPLGGDTVTMLNLPPVRMGLLTKLNLLTIGLIFLTAVAITGFYFTQQWRDAELQLKTQGASMLGMMAELAEYGVYTSDRAYLEQMLDSLGADPDVAYVAVLDMQQQVLAERRFAPGPAKSALPALPAQRIAFGTGRIAATGDRRRRPALHRTRRADCQSGVRRLGLRWAIRWSPIAASKTSTAAPIGLIRLGMSLDVQRKQFREQMVGAIGVVGLLVVFATLATLLLTRRLVAPMRRLMRAARAVGSGRLDVYVPAHSSDELGLLDAHVQPHDAEALGIAIRSRELSAHAGGKGRAADARARSRDRAGVQACATRHPDRLAEPVAAQSAVEADPRPRRNATARMSVACSSTSTISSGSTTRSGTTPATSSCRRLRSG